MFHVLMLSIIHLRCQTTCGYFYHFVTKQILKRSKTFPARPPDDSMMTDMSHSCRFAVPIFLLFRYHRDSRTRLCDEEEDKNISRGDILAPIVSGRCHLVAVCVPRNIVRKCSPFTEQPKHITRVSTMQNCSEYLEINFLIQSIAKIIPWPCLIDKLWTWKRKNVSRHFYMKPIPFVRF